MPYVYIVRDPDSGGLITYGPFVNPDDPRVVADRATRKDHELFTVWMQPLSALDDKAAG